MGKNQRVLDVTQKDFYYLGYPVKTKFGIVVPIKVKDYPFVLSDLEIIQLDDFEWVRQFKKHAFLTNDNRFRDVANQIEKDGLISCIHTNVGNLKDLYAKALGVFMQDFSGSDLFKLHTYSDLEELVATIYEVNSLPLKEKSKSEEMQKWINLAKVYKNRKTGKLTFEAMLTSIAKEFGYKPHDVNDLTLYQLFKDFKRIEHFKNYDLTTLFKTVDYKDKVKIQSWYGSGDDEPIDEIEPVDPTKMDRVHMK